MHRERIFGGHVGEYMEYLEEEDNTKYQEQFAGYIAAGIDADGLEELYEGVHEKIREDPSPSEKKSFTPDKSFKRKAKLTLEQRKAAVQAKKDAKIAELEEDDEGKNLLELRMRVLWLSVLFAGQDSETPEMSSQIQTEVRDSAKVRCFPPDF
ncbi:hypothetical protein THAOC_31437 [Thalassiosira oceanica]|uniref:Large ribosomal subunit protein uL18 C-terminal eukaryotes domain-containing protein n=1 Tax=Thalassiosira oceanica TaxID=159749 RepID=K0RBM7_THAOC|nr:hypothetical protein THAOC_31437 [Thalassiosira oceanica]|eukprot:EJK49664.1 hypothetical protein THAOC_31437 [Thalassiosira oceanica]